MNLADTLMRRTAIAVQFVLTRQTHPVSYTHLTLPTTPYV